MKKRRTRRARKADQRGVALVMVIASITILAVFVAELLENTTTDFQEAVAERDRLKAEYLAKSGINLTRLLIAREPQINAVISPLMQAAIGIKAPQINVWDFTDLLLGPFADPTGNEALAEETGIDFGMMEGIKTDTGGTFEVIATPENGKINLSKPLFYRVSSGASNDPSDARLSISQQLFGLMGGYQTPESPYDPMFSARDADGQYTTRLDIVSAMIDWWDPDENRTIFDPAQGKGAIAESGSEDDVYSQFVDPYRVKNAPFDSLEELRLIRGVGDDFWATFIEDPSGDPRARKVTVYASGSVNVNQAQPEVLLSRLCPFLVGEPLCDDPIQAAAFITMFKTLRSVVQGLPLFPSADAFLDFVSGGGGGGAGGQGKGPNLYALLSTYLAMMGMEGLMAWTPVKIPANQRATIASRFLVVAQIFTIQSTAQVGRAQAKMSLVVNFDPAWVPPKGVPGSLPALGAVHHYRLD